jgi:CHASE2 domain-containing sensor protein
MVQVDNRAALDDLLEKCTVKLTVANKAGWGTGFFVAPGKILTCAHVVKDAGSQALKVFWQTQEPVEATVYGLFPDPFDLALLELKHPIAHHPCVYLDRVSKTETAIQSGDELYTYGYPDDFPNGAPVTASCEGLTGDQPSIIKFKAGQIRPGLSGSPLLNRRTHKVCGIVKFTRDRSDDLGGGAIPAQPILTKFNDLAELQEKFHKQDDRWSSLLPLTRCRPRTVLLTSVGITAFVVILRFVGLLQSVELVAYDHLMRTRLGGGADDRIRVIQIDLNDIAAQKARGERLIDSLSNESLTALLVKLNTFKPRVVGLDIYRDDRDVIDQYPDLMEHFQNQDNLIGVCKANDDPKLQVSGIEPPPGIPLRRFGFSDFILDNDDVLRRQLLAFQPEANSPCPSQLSFSLQIADHYLKADNIHYKKPVIVDGYCQDLRFDNGVTFHNFQPFTGGYQFERNSGGCQVLLNYRDRSIVEKPFTLEQVLARNDLANEFRDKIVLIGIAHRDNVQDYWNTPFGILPDQEMPGVFVQAQMVSQILSVVKGERSLIWVMPQWGEWLWIWCWALTGGFLAWRLRSLKQLSLAMLGAGMSLYAVCLLTFQFNGWVPLLPPSIALGATGAGIWWISLQSSLSIGTNRKFLLPQNHG